MSPRHWRISLPAGPWSTSQPRVRRAHAPQVDRRVEDALRAAVRRSLAELARLLAGDKRAEMAPLFTVALALERTNCIELRPTVQAPHFCQLGFWWPRRRPVTKCWRTSVSAADVHVSHARSCSTWCMLQAWRL